MFQHRVRLLASLRFGQAQLLHPAIMCFSERSLDPTLHLWKMGANQRDVQLRQGPPELRLRLGISQRLPLLVRLENAVPVRVKGKVLEGKSGKGEREGQ